MATKSLHGNDPSHTRRLTIPSSGENALTDVRLMVWLFTSSHIHSMENLLRVRYDTRKEYTSKDNFWITITTVYGVLNVEGLI